MTLKKIIFATAVLFLSVTAVNAVPAKPGVKKTIKTSEGRIIEATLRGDEHLSFFSDAEGMLYLRNTDGLFTRTSNEVASNVWTNRRQAAMARNSQSLSRRTSNRVGQAKTTEGKHRGLVILIQFADVSFVTANPQSTFNRFFNEAGYSDNGMAGSVKDFFLAQSYDQLEIDFDVVGPYTTQYKMEYYGAPNGDRNDSRPAEMVATAVDKAAAEGVDFSNYDWDKDGEVDQVFVIYAGYNQAQGADENTIWPHESSLAGWGQKRTYNGVDINIYGCSSELSGNGKTDTGILDGIGTACHEFSHCLGLPDMYDTKAQENFGMSAWDVMDYGSYNDNSRTPAGYTAYERWFSGWMEPTEITELTRINGMKPLSTTPEAYVIYNKKNKNEFYLLENRQSVGFDAGLYGHGMLVVHVDYDENAWSQNNLNTVANHQRMTIIPADNDFALSLTGLAGDPWPGVKKNTMLTNNTQPAATLYNANTDGSYFMNMNIDNISEDTDAHTVSFVVGRPELEIPDMTNSTAVVSGSSLTIGWPAVTGATGYEIELTTMNQAATDPAEALRREVDFSKCYSKSAGFTDISSMLAQYGLSNWKGSKLYTSPKYLKIGTSTVTGYLQSPTWEVPSSSNLTIVIGAEAGSSAVKLDATITYGNQGDLISDCPTQTAEVTISANGKYVIQFKDVRKNLFWTTMTPNAMMYMNYFAVYDGLWTAEQLGITTAASRRANAEVNTYTSMTNSYTFADLDTSKRYAYRVRALGEENTYSQWSVEKEFDFNSTDIHILERDQEITFTRFFDLQGREVKTPTRGLYIRNGKKFVVK